MGRKMLEVSGFKEIAVRCGDTGSKQGNPFEVTKNEIMNQRQQGHVIWGVGAAYF